MDTDTSSCRPYTFKTYVTDHFGSVALCSYQGRSLFRDDGGTRHVASFFAELLTRRTRIGGIYKSVELVIAQIKSMTCRVTKRKAIVRCYLVNKSGS